MNVEGRGLSFDAEIRLLTVTTQAGRVELEFVHQHETEPAILVILTTEGRG
jgi:hypothetical protein